MPEDHLDPEDAKLVTLARAARARSGAAEGAAVRDTDGRTYAATTVALPSLALSALQVAVAMAVSSGAQGLEGAAVVGEVTATDTSTPHAAGLAAARDLTRDVPVFLADPAGLLVGRA
ncbi:MAG TPA: cytidine deaminase [Cryptosporangiaceae bacterium]|nr:cytidine deaminase [Cryptosporangiaceae bacterium]